MAVLYGTEMTKLRVSPTQTPDPGFVDGGVHVFNESITLASQTISDTIEIARLPIGCIPLYGILHSDVSLVTSVVSIGITGTTAKYRAAAVFTATGTPTLFGADIGDAISAEEIVFITIATASLPASGTLRVMMYYTWN